MKRLPFSITLFIGSIWTIPAWAQPHTVDNVNGQLPNGVIEQLWQLAIVTLLVYSLTSALKVLSDNRLKRLLIEKGLATHQVKHLFGQDPRIGLLQALRYGLLALGIGGGLWCNHFLPFGLITFGMIGLGAGLGFLSYVFIAYRLIKRSSMWRDISKPDDEATQKQP